MSYPRWLYAGRVALAVLVAGAAFLLVSNSRRRAAGAAAAHSAHWVQSGNFRLRFVRAGSGPVVVLIHGYGESLIAWRAMFDELARHADVIALDLPGFGLSSKPRTGYQTDSIAAVVIAALDSLKVERYVLVGHSMGGAVSAAIARRVPARVAGLVLINAAAVTPPTLLPTGSDRDASVRSLRLAIAEYELLRRRFRPPLDPDWVAAPDSASAGYDQAADTSYRVVLQSVLGEFDFAYLTPERARDVAASTLIIWGELDPLVPNGDAERLAVLLPRARLEVVERSWHRPHVERPDAVAALIVQFLDTL